MQPPEAGWFNKGMEMKNKTDIKVLSVGTKIEWKWVGRKISGEVVEVFYEVVSKKIKEKIIKRNASKENPAYLVKSLAGNLALKLHSELAPIETKKATILKPKMFNS